MSELGIQLTLTEPIKDLIYSVRDVGSSDGTITSPAAYFSTRALVEADANCSAENGSIGALQTFPGQYPYSSDYSHKYGHFRKQLPSLFVTASFPSAVCSDNELANQLESARRSAFGDTIQTIEEIK